MAVLLLGIAAMVFMAVYGAILSWRPDRFLRFHDTFVDRNKRHRDAKWRSEIDTPAYRLLGWAFTIVGLFFALMLTARLISTLR